jgi:DNA mismatch repair protein MutS
MLQHAAAKRAHPDAILFFRLGDFYEMFGEDAVLAAKLLDLTLTSRNKGKPDEIPLAGVPYHAAQGYIGRLLEAGYKVAICEQMADPSKVKGIVPREVVRVITPGLVTDGEQLEATTNNWLAAVDLGDKESGLALLDLSTGELRAAKLTGIPMLLGELGCARPRELILGDTETGTHDVDDALALVRRVLPCTALRRDDELLCASEAEHLGTLEQDARELPDSARRAAARALRFARVCNPSTSLPIHRIAHWDPSDCLLVDTTAQQHLELVESPAGGRAATLLGVIDATRTPGGARLLRTRLLSPLVDVARIRRRLDLVELFVQNPRVREDFRGAIARVNDLERLAVRAELGEATPRDLGALRDGLAAADCAVSILDDIDDAAMREVLGLGESKPDTVRDLADELERALVERPPAQPKDGGVFRRAYDAELDELDALRKSGTERMSALEARLREETGVSSLKVRFTRVFGWYIEVTRSQAGRAPEQWRRKQTVASGERYTTPELDDLADRIAHAEDRHRERELSLLAELARTAAQASQRVRTLTALVSRWDVSAALADVAHRYDYVRPEVDDSDVLEIRDGRHPVVERLAAKGRFVPNDVRLDLKGQRFWLITGPNMAGKSTLLRQVAAVVILAQMGSYVPARLARVGLVDRVLSRVGASDNLSQGQSTFMVEMRETAQILRSATQRSLVILDEIGRGTSTLDGLSIAWSVAEYLDEAIGCRALFATHYHEITALADGSRHIANYSVSARELGDDVVFLHRLVVGPASRSYGVAVAKLAGLPEPVLARARAILGNLECADRPALTPSLRSKGREGKASDGQLGLFSAPVQSSSHLDVLDTLRALDVDGLTPLEALGLLARLKQRL